MMMDFISSLFIASFAGTILWILQYSLKPITQKYFSQTWHYYSSLIPVFFLLGGSGIMSRLVSFIPSASTSPNHIQDSGMMTELHDQVSTIEQTAANVSLWITQRFDELRRFSSAKEFMLIAAIIWAVGAAAFIVVHIRKYRGFKRSILKGSRTWHIEPCPVQVIASPHATTPLIMGYWNPMVVLPDISLGEQKLAMILSHELVHLKRGDLLIKLMIFAANAIHWFNPAAYILNRQISMFCELSCDEKVVQHMDIEGRRSYGETLISMLEYGVMRKNVMGTSSLCSSKEHMKRRLIHLMNEKKMNKPVMALSIVAAIALVGGGGAAAYAAESASKTTTVTQVEGFNVTVEYPDGRIEAFDKDGNRVAAKSKESYAPKKLTTEEIVDRIKKHIEKGITVPQGYIDELPQQNLEAINESYHLKLQKSNRN
ncbi:M56 family metallopeptidase [Paenibacillus ihumii]|uniref:M56 family metallopeptidase n=1 Tax=Paenibacillus ihumii TaxID=687436 RepID=UPI0006D8096D|nr:M56 family metallopeptidase [Paenibacillus ihumii]